MNWGAEEIEAASAGLLREFWVRQEAALLLCLRERRSSGGEGTEGQQSADDLTGRGFERKDAHLAGRLWVNILRQGDGSVTRRA